MIRRGLLIFFILLTVFSFGKIAHAQIDTNNISVNITPSRPGPRQNTSITLTSYSTNLAAASISWTEDGKITLEGIGKTRYAFVTKDVGIPTTIGINITVIGQTPIIKQVVINPMGVDLLWEAADSTVPPLYRGKALPSSEAAIKFVAMPEIKSPGNGLLSPTDLVYTWKLNYNSDQGNSGYGRQSYTFKANYLNQSEHIDLSVNSRDGNLGADGSGDIVTGDPKIVWYASSPLYGPQFDMALGNDYTVNSNQISLLAMPYFFSPNDPNALDIIYKWNLNGKQIDAQNPRNSLFLNRDTGSAGDADISLDVSNAIRLFQTATSSLTLHLQ